MVTHFGFDDVTITRQLIQNGYSVDGFRFQISDDKHATVVSICANDRRYFTLRCVFSASEQNRACHGYSVLYHRFEKDAIKSATRREAELRKG